MSNKKYRSVIDQQLKNYHRFTGKLYPNTNNLTQKLVYLNTLKHKISSIVDPISLLKCAVMIHKIILQSNFNQHSQLLQILNTLSYSQTIQRIIFKSKFKNNQYLDQLVIQKVYIPYFNYLQKRSSKNNAIQQLQSYTHPQYMLNNIFLFINLINQVAVFSHHIFTFGRYYKSAFPFIIDFNILLAIDIRKIYHKLNRYCYNLYQKINMVNQNQRRIMEYAINLAIDIKEKLNVIYLNCYYCDYVKQYVPYWINIEFDYENRDNSTQKRNQNPAKSQIQASTNSKTNDRSSQQQLKHLVIINPFTSNQKYQKNNIQEQTIVCLNIQNKQQNIQKFSLIKI